MNCPLDNKDMNKFAICNSTEPTTCFDASNAQILIGLCGLSLHLLYTSDRRASAPRAPCIKREAGPRRRHSPFSAPGRLSESLLEFEVAVAVAVSMAEKAVEMTTVGMIGGRVAGSIVGRATSVGRARKGDSGDEACWRNDIRS